MSFDLSKIIRKNIAELKPYSSARDEYSGQDGIFLDANENPHNLPYNRYPDPKQLLLKKKVSSIFSIHQECIFLGNGSDEGIDLLFRAFCEPGKHNVVSVDPSYGMYNVCAGIQGVEFRKHLLEPDFSLNSNAMLSMADSDTRMLFVCSPNNPTANLIDRGEIMKLLKQFQGLVVVDEAYIDFSGENGVIDLLQKFPNLVILRTLSKAWGLAGIRLGMVFASAGIISVLNRIKYPYNINSLTLEYASSALDKTEEKEKWVREIISERQRMKGELEKHNLVLKVFPSDANFLLVKVADPQSMYNYLKTEGIIVRDRSSQPLCQGCLRITIGKRVENDLLLKKLNSYSERN